MAKTANEWRLEEAYPPMRMVEFTPLRKKVVAEWLHCAGLTCDEYDLSRIAEKIELIVLDELRGVAHTPWRSVMFLTRNEEE
jgi:hypothetical protein